MSIHRIVVLVNLGLITLAAYFGVNLFYNMVGLYIQPQQKAESTTVAIAPQKTEKQLPAQHFRAILERDLFQTKKEPVKPDPAKVNVENLEETKLQLKLWGTVAGEQDKAYAVIEDTKKREQNLYRVGDSLQNATVKMIMREKVVLLVNGKDEILAMEKVTQGSGRGSKFQTHASSAPPSLSPRPSVRAQRISLRRSMIEDAIKDVSKLMTQIAIRPHMEDGQAAGLSMNNIKPNSIFRRMGLRNGDILMGVDGQDIRTVDDALRLYENLKSSDNVTVQLKRRGRERTINYTIR